MNNLYEFMSDSPIVTVLIVWAVTSMFGTIVRSIVRGYNIRKNGYPPPHCDANGNLQSHKDTVDMESK